jgi:SAM-dependent methyltransferase
VSDDVEGIERVCAAIATRCARREISPAVALMEMLIACEDLARVRAAVAASGDAALAALLFGHEAGAARVATMLRSDVDVPPRGGSVEDGVAFCKHLFDWSVRQSEEASVALYSLGSPALLEAATAEIVQLLDAWGLLGLHRRALDIGCGIGRMEVALASRLGRIDAIDVSAGMIEAAGRRCAGLANVHLALATGLDLAMFDAGTFDLVLAVDTFPYLVQSGMPLVSTHIVEAARVLAPRGDLVVLNFSYRDDTARDDGDVALLADSAGMEIVSSGTRPFALWNGVAFHLRRGA